MCAKVCFLFVFIAFVVIKKNFGDESCNLLINEVNTGSPEHFKKTDFIELKMICESDDSKPRIKSLQGYKMIGISISAGKSENAQLMTIDFVVNLWNSKINEQNMFTIGSEDVPNTDMHFNSAYVAYQSKFNKKTQTITSFLTKDSKHIHAIALLYKASYSFPEIVLSAKTPSIVINEKLQETI